MKNRSLGVVTEIVEAAGLSVSYAYDDLVFLEHPDLMLQFTDSAEEVLIHIDEEAGAESLAVLLSKIKNEAAVQSMVFKMGNFFRVGQEGKETVTIEFLSTFESENEGING